MMARKRKPSAQDLADARARRKSLLAATQTIRAFSTEHAAAAARKLRAVSDAEWQAAVAADGEAVAEYDPDQARDDSGQWTSGGAGRASSLRPGETRNISITGGKSYPTTWDSLSGKKIRQRGTSYTGTVIGTTPNYTGTGGKSIYVAHFIRQGTVLIHRKDFVMTKINQEIASAT